jgi:hypothetical protein
LCIIANFVKLGFKGRGFSPLFIFLEGMIKNRWVPF